jgi:hypothetical protein
MNKQKTVNIVLLCNPSSSFAWTAIIVHSVINKELWSSFWLIPEPTARSAVPGVSPGRGY